MDFELISHRLAKEILQAKGVFELITNLIENFRCQDPTDLHEELKKLLDQNGFNMEIPIFGDIAITRAQMFDNYSNEYRIGVEIETSRYEWLYRDYMRFIRADQANMVDVGILIVFADKALAKSSKKWPEHAPKLKDIKDDLKMFYATITIPILAIGLKHIPKLDSIIL